MATLWHANLFVVCWLWLTWNSVYSRLDSSPCYCRELLGIELAWEPKERMDMLLNIYLYPVPQCKQPRYCKLRTSKTVRFPRQVAECLTKLPENYSLAHIPFLYRDFNFLLLLSQLVQIQTKSVYFVYPKIRQGRRGFPFKNYCSWHP